MCLSCCLTWYHNIISYSKIDCGRVIRGGIRSWQALMSTKMKVTYMLHLLNQARLVIRKRSIFDLLSWIYTSPISSVYDVKITFFTCIFHVLAERIPSLQDNANQRKQWPTLPHLSISHPLAMCFVLTSFSLNWHFPIIF